jgi:hypothetical protein
MDCQEQAGGQGAELDNMEVPKVLYRNTDQKFAKAFVEEGEIMFRSLTYYRSVEDSIRRDDTDGVWIKCAPAKSVTYTRDDLPDGDPLNGVSIKHKAVGNVKITVPAPKSELMVISCFSTVQQENFGCGKIEIFNICGFIECVKAALSEAKLPLKYGAVEYCDSDSRLPGQNDLWRQKENKFSLQKEFRLGILLPENRIVRHKDHTEDLTIAESSLTLNCGSLEKYAKLL